MAADPRNGERIVAYRNARLLDPASGLDTPGGLLTKGAEIVELATRPL